MDMELEIAQVLVKMSCSPKRPAAEIQGNRQKRVCSPQTARSPKLNKDKTEGEKTSRSKRSTTTIVRYMDPNNPKLVEICNRFSKNDMIPLGFESRFYQNRVNWKMEIVHNPTNPSICFVISTVDKEKGITSGPQASAWVAYIRALETYHETYPEEYLGKINPNYNNPAAVEKLGAKNAIVGVNARNIVGLYNPDVQEKIRKLFS